MPTAGNTMPDVAALFRAHFGAKPKKLNLAFGSDSNFIHNLEFLSGLTHESRLQADKVRWKEGGPIRFPMLRERTELPLVEVRKSLVRQTIDSVLTIQPVSAVSWVFHREFPLNPSDLEIFSIHLGLDFWNGESDAFTLHLVGQMWRCDLTVSSREPVFKLSDTTSPKYRVLAPKPASLALLAILCLSGLTGGCARTYAEYTPEALQREMDRASRNSAEAWFYAGSEGGFHYLVARAGTNPKWIKISAKSMRLDMPLTARSWSPSSWTVLHFTRVHFCQKDDPSCEAALPAEMK